IPEASTRSMAVGFEGSAPSVVPGEVVEQVLDTHAAVGRAAGRAVVHIGPERTGVVRTEEVDQVLDAHAAVGGSAAAAVVHVGDAGVVGVESKAGDFQTGDV